jgi:hypothetical protein
MLSRDKTNVSPERNEELYILMSIEIRHLVVFIEKKYEFPVKTGSDVRY